MGCHPPEFTAALKVGNFGHIAACWHDLSTEHVTLI